MSVDPARALRSGATFQVSTRAALVAVSGARAREILEQCLPCALTLYDAQARSTVFLDREGDVVADVTVGKFESGYWLIVDGLTAEESIARLEEARGSDASIAITDLRTTLAQISIHGPYVWELMSGWLGRSAVALPPLAFLRVRDVVVLRAGRTGEYGYEVFVPSAQLDEIVAGLRARGAPLDLAETTSELLDTCTLEVGGFVMRHLGGPGRSPIELQLQWRVTRDKPEVRELVDRRRASATHRITWFTSADAIAKGTELRYGDELAGSVLFGARATTRDGGFGVALVRAPLAHPRLTFAVVDGALSTATPPLVQPLSRTVRLHLDPYARRK